MGSSLLPALLVVQSLGGPKSPTQACGWGGSALGKVCTSNGSDQSRCGLFSLNRLRRRRRRAGICNPNASHGVFRYSPARRRVYRWLWKLRFELPLHSNGTILCHDKSEFRLLLISHTRFGNCGEAQCHWNIHFSWGLTPMTSLGHSRLRLMVKVV
jgi:hypothetical protein